MHVSFVKNTIRSAWLMAIAICSLVAPAWACLWDRDTLKHEARGVTGVVEVIIGRVERYPPLYYEMRLARVAAELEANPSKLDLYDDAGVACDRLRRSDEAIEWMARKKTQLDALAAANPLANEHLYRYHANLGTFLAHRWFRAGASREDLKDLEAGRAHIAQAIEINPDAHFGREKFQLLALDWVLTDPKPTGSALSTIFDADPENDRAIRSTDERRKAIQGLTGLIALGDAWESFDIFAALAQVLAWNEDTSLSRLASRRLEEIVQSGGKSFSRHNYDSSEAENWPRIGPFTGYEIHDSHVVDEFFHRARRAADEWRQARESFLLAGLNRGRHPDTDPNFWTGYVERPAPARPVTWLGGDIQLYLKTGLVVLLVAAAGFVFVRVIRRAKVSAAPQPHI
jgi:tetratricopeptide (TPR) repeat protein